MFIDSATIDLSWAILVFHIAHAALAGWAGYRAVLRWIEEE